MKYALALMAASASLDQAQATFFFGKTWQNAPMYNTPGQMDNYYCNEKQKSGWDWQGLPDGQVSTYDGLALKGFSVMSGGSASKRDLRNRGLLDKFITGESSPDMNESPSIESPDNTFSIDSFEMSTEFDTRMEFHYEMEDGSICKTTQDSGTDITTIVNSQCGGAKKVTFIHPEDPQQNNEKRTLGKLGKKKKFWKKKCKTKIHKVKWHCKKKMKPSTTPIVTQPGTVTQPARNHPH
ncbi:hypothetical protein CDD82_6273 [Ophiocordyceps australis]|uniref:Uncharacterized protein n=1 Tax=Ophiocordyceps australis TaxID=1399860 RepID=A0A2C5YWM1_9HYPO|nr:hypothetical protein CDD82_6273 [Ophiocordyceps australis]